VTKVVLLLGAGATVADVATKPRKDRPPLDRLFFAEAQQTHSSEVEMVAQYVRVTYEINILDRANDRLEDVMGLIYTDLFNPILAADALTAFRALLRLFTRRLATTTNSIQATNKRVVYRMIAHYLGHGVSPDELTIVTFNQDIQVEKMLALMRVVRRWKHISDKVFSFPHLYAFEHTPSVTAPSGAPAPASYSPRAETPTDASVS